MTATQRSDIWAAGDAYEHYMGRWSRPVARDFVDWLGLPRGGRWLDVGCGTGALAQAILERASPAGVVAIDPSDPFIAHARRHTRDPGVNFERADAGKLPFPSMTFDAVVSGLVLNFISKPEQALAEMKRVLRPGGTCAAYVWDYAGEMQLLRHFWDAAVALDPAACDADERNRFPICKPQTLVALFNDCGFERTQARALDVPTVFANFDDYWSPFLGGQGPAPAYCTTLPEHRRALLRERARASLPVQGDGSIQLRARAFAVRGRVPASENLRSNEQGGMT